jgi:hypothetical protein
MVPIGLNSSLRAAERQAAAFGPAAWAAKEIRWYPRHLNFERGALCAVEYATFITFLLPMNP